ncbi:hypothetical protein [Streptomyces sp. NPDC005548]
MTGLLPAVAFTAMTVALTYLATVDWTHHQPATQATNHPET